MCADSHARTPPPQAVQPRSQGTSDYMIEPAAPVHVMEEVIFATERGESLSWNTFLFEECTEEEIFSITGQLVVLKIRRAPSNNHIRTSFTTCASPVATTMSGFSFL